MEAGISTIIEYHTENMNRNKKYGMYFAINIYKKLFNRIILVLNLNLIGRFIYNERYKKRIGGNIKGRS